ncbi:glycosyltransferase family A protein [Streptosporangium sp. NPDC006007]|uniref:glycosyltransferase family A protein n=1 Tax=Streptosporangium sp. NPDC006007 TaxID=3154575 RepID=UPI0033B729CF
MSEIPPHVTVLAEQWARARTIRDRAGADALRDEIEGHGWLVRDTGDGFELTPRPPFEVWPTVGSIPVPGRAGSDGMPDSEGAAGPERSGAAGREAVSPDAGRVERAADPEARPERLGDLDAGRVAETEAAPRQRPQGSELVGRSAGNEGDSERMLSSQLLWDSSLAVSRLDEEITPIRAEERAAPPTVTVGLVVDGWPDDLRECVRALIARTEVKVIALDLGNVDGAGIVLRELADEYPRRVRGWHVAETPHWRGGSAGWGESRTKLLELDTSDVHIVMETSTIMDGDAITPLVVALTDDVVAAGWKGVNPGEDGHDWHEAGPGEVRAVLGDLFAVRRDAALAAGGFSRDARYYRNADLEFSLRLSGTVVALGEDPPVHQERHRGYHDVDPGYRDRESGRTYDRVLGLLRAT